MNSKSFIGLAVLAALAVMPGCSTSKTASTDQATPPAALPTELEWRNAQLIPRPPAEEPPGQFCLLGTTCLAMDPRPFELCLLSTKNCGDKASEPMQVAPQWIIPVPGVIRVESQH